MFQYPGQQGLGGWGEVHRVPLEQHAQLDLQQQKSEQTMRGDLVDLTGLGGLGGLDGT